MDIRRMFCKLLYLYTLFEHHWFHLVSLNNLNGRRMDVSISTCVYLVITDFISNRSSQRSLSYVDFWIKVGWQLCFYFILTAFKVGPLSKPYRVHCLCNHLTAFGAGLTVPMNTINLNDSGFAKLDENPVIFATMVSLMCLYVLMLIWARKRDLLDKVMVWPQFYINDSNSIYKVFLSITFK